MAFTLTFLDRKQGVLLTAGDTLSSEDLLRINQQVGLLAEVVPGVRYLICDCSQVRRIDFDRSFMYQIAIRNMVVARRFNPGLFAVVAEEPYVFAHARIWWSYVQQCDWEVMPFRNLTEAKEWIGELGRKMFDSTLSCETMA